MIVGITGGLGCGKSTAAKAFEARGFRRLDSDRIVREQVLADPTVIAALRARYGDEILVRDGSSSPAQASGNASADGGQGATAVHPAAVQDPRVDRAALAQRVFADDEELHWLEELTHPRVFAVWRTAFAADPGAKWIVEVPLLHEKGLENWFDFTVCVACAPAIQLARVEQRGLPRALAGQRISKQLPLARKIELSDFVLWNEGSLAFLEAQVDRLAEAFVAA